MGVVGSMILCRPERTSNICASSALSLPQDSKFGSGSTFEGGLRSQCCLRRVLRWSRTRHWAPFQDKILSYRPDLIQNFPWVVLGWMHHPSTTFSIFAPQMFGPLWSKFEGSWAHSPIWVLPQWPPLQPSPVSLLAQMNRWKNSHTAREGYVDWEAP